MTPTRWRTILFTPGTRPDRVERAWREGAADVVVLDLEDAVPADAKDAARRDAARLLAETEGGPCRRAVRINVWPGPVADADLMALAAAPLPDLLVVPKAEDPQAIHALHARLAAAGDPPGLLLILETARGVLAAQALAACPGVAALAFGAEDLAADAGLARSPGNAEVAVPRALVALAAAAERVAAIDMITADFRDTERTRREATEARALGYAGKMCLHPAQVDVVRAAFAPTAQEVAWARKVADAAAAANAEAGGVVVVGGRMIDAPLIRQAHRILDAAE